MVAGTSVVSPIVGDGVCLGHLSVLLLLRLVLNRIFARGKLLLRSGLSHRHTINLLLRETLRLLAESSVRSFMKGTKLVVDCAESLAILAHEGTVSSLAVAISRAHLCGVAC